MSRDEIKAEIEKVRQEITGLEPGSLRIGELTTALVALYEMLVVDYEKSA